MAELGLLREGFFGHDSMVAILKSLVPPEVWADDGMLVAGDIDIAIMEKYIALFNLWDIYLMVVPANLQPWNSPAELITGMYRGLRESVSGEDLLFIIEKRIKSLICESWVTAPRI